MNAKKNLIWILGISIAIFLAACDNLSVQQTATPTATLIPISYPTPVYTSNRMVVEGEGSKTEMGNVGTLPEELPKDVPIYYPGYPKTWIIEYKEENAPFFSIGIEAGDEQTIVVDWYKNELNSNNWTIGILDVDMGSIQCNDEQLTPEVIDAKKDGRAISISICPTKCSTYCTTWISIGYTEIK